MSIIRFGIVGFGNIGTRHAKHIQQHPEAQLIAVCDIEPQRFEQLTGANILQTANFTDILQNPNIDVINVCVPNHLHAPYTIAALQAGKHVVCEKPMALSATECTQMIAAADTAHRKLFVVKQNRYNPPVNAVKQLINNNQLGTIYQMLINCFWNRNENYYQNSDWRGKKNKDGGCLFTQCSHFIDIMYYLVGDVDCIAGTISNFGHKNSVEFEDSGAFVLRSKQSQAIIGFNFSTCTYQKNMEGSITIIAEKGTVKIGGQYLNTIEYQQISNYQIANLPTGNAPNDYGGYQGSMSNHDKVIQNVIDTLNNRDTINTIGEEGKKTIEIIEKMYASVK
jgi:UDP-N-acetyl-2-amino-2-deoxyglucuronate dehydrogenase